MRTSVSMTVIAVLMIPGFVHAQEPQDEAGGLDEVVVTATRRETSAQRTSIAITSLDSVSLARNGVATPGDVGKLVPGLQIAAAGTGSQVFLRGIGNFSTSFYAENAIAFSQDQVYFARSGSMSTVLYDVERIEVLKGPQGTLYGRNATGGAINLITKKPTWDRNGDLSIEGGDYDRIRVTGAVNVPLGDRVAVRAAGMYYNTDSYTDDGTTDQHFGAGRVHALIKLSDKGTLLLSGDLAQLEGGGPAAYPTTSLAVGPVGYTRPSNDWTGGATPAVNAFLAGTSGFLHAVGALPPGVNIQPLLTDGFQKVQSWGLSADLEYELPFAGLTVIPALRHLNVRARNYPGFQYNSDEDSRQFTTEARLASNYESKLQWVAGAFYINEDARSLQNADQGVLNTLIQLPTLDGNSWAVFGEGTFSVTDHFRLIAGTRYTYEKKEQLGSNSQNLNLVPLPVGPFTSYPAFCGGTGGAFSVDAGSRPTCTWPVAGQTSWNSTTWKGGMEFDLAKDSMMYLTASSGFKAGGFYGSLPPNAFGPEHLTSYALGSKNRFLQNRLQLNGEVFYWDYKDQQTVHLGAIRPTGFGLVTENIGRVPMLGVDVSLEWLATRNDRIALGGNWLRANTSGFVYNAVLTTPTANVSTGCSTSAPFFNTADNNFYRSVDCSGRPIPRAPKWTGTLDYEHTFALPADFSLIAGVHSVYSSEQWITIDYLPGSRQGSYHTTDLNLTLAAREDKWSVRAWVRNLENDAVLSTAFQHPFVAGGFFGSYRPPRTYGLTLSANF